MGPGSAPFAQSFAAAMFAALLLAGALAAFLIDAETKRVALA